MYRLFALSILLTTPTAMAALPLESALDQVRPEPDADKDVALIVAIEDYDKAPDIPGARANARLWRQWFRARGTRDVRVIEDADASHGWGRDGKPHGLLPKVDAAATQARKQGGTLWFVFIGHGAPVSDRGQAQGVLLAHGVQQTAQSLRTHGIFVDSDLMPRLAKARKSVAVLDACFSGQSSDGALVPGLQPLIPAAFNVSKAVTVFTAAKGTEFAGPLPGANRPAFSYLMLGALAGWADGEMDRKRDQQVTSDEAFEWVKLQMARVIHGRRQTPTMRGPRRALSRAWAAVANAVIHHPRQVGYGPSERLFREAEITFIEMNAIGLSARQGESSKAWQPRLRKALVAKANLMKICVDKYFRVIRHHSEPWSSAALHRIGESYSRFAQALHNTRLPHDLTEDEHIVYRAELDDVAAPLQEKARIAARKADKIARANNRRNVWTRQTEALLLQLQ